MSLPQGTKSTSLREQLDAFDDARRQGSMEEATKILQEIGSRGEEQAIDALTDLVFRLEGRLQFAAVHAIALSPQAYAHERLRDLARDRQQASVRRQAARDLASGTEGDRLWLRDKRLSQEKDPMLRAEILRMLLQHEVPRLEQAVLAASRSVNAVEAGIGIEGVGRLRLRRGLPAVGRALDGPDPVLRRAALEALDSFGGPRATGLLLDAYGKPENLALRPVIQQLLWQRHRPKELEVLATDGLRHAEPSVVHLTADILALRADLAPKTSIGPLSHLLQQDDPVLLSRAVEGLVLAKPSALATLLGSRLRGLDADDPRVADLLWGLSTLDKLPSSQLRYMPQWMNSTSAAVRVQSLGLLATRKAKDDAQEWAHAALEDDSWSVRLAAVRCWQQWRQQEGIPHLIDTLAREHGSVQLAAHEALAALTGKELGLSASAWEAWWQEQGPDYVLPSLEQVAQARAAKMPLDADPAATHTVSERRYHGLAIHDGGSLFLLDASGSMEEDFDASRSKYQVYAENLLQTIGGLSAKASFGMMLFSGDAQLWRSELAANRPEHVDAAAKFLTQASLGGPTDLHDALVTALAIPEVESLYVLTDGAPTSGFLRDTESLLQVVARANRHLGVRIHTIDIGSETCELLERLAQDNGGQYVRPELAHP
jgi:hypothetical protein